MTVATSTRVPAMHGLPNRIPGSTEMPGKISTLALLTVCDAVLSARRTYSAKKATELSSEDMSEIVFLVEQAPEGGFTARAVSESIFTEADDLSQLHERAREAVRCHFD